MLESLIKGLPVVIPPVEMPSMLAGAIAIYVGFSDDLLFYALLPDARSLSTCEESFGLHGG